ncbi:MAG: hypothetical protein Q8O43_00770 [Dehalococcoidia bacterium]|nr:hypothetical protein [Dehalococcoidia bacterium]
MADLNHLKEWLYRRRTMTRQEMKRTERWQLGIMINRRHEEYHGTMTWLGGRFQPALFSVEKVNRRLKPVRLP